MGQIKNARAMFSYILFHMGKKNKWNNRMATWEDFKPSNYF